MTTKPHDEFSKLYLKGMLSPFGQEVEISFEVPTGEPQQVDVWFIPKSHQPIAELGLLGKMATTPALLEAFRNPISEDDLFACLGKLCKVRDELKRTARREKRLYSCGCSVVTQFRPKRSQNCYNHQHTLSERSP